MVIDIFLGDWRLWKGSRSFVKRKHDVSASYSIYQLFH